MTYLFGGLILLTILLCFPALWRGVMSLLPFGRGARFEEEVVPAGPCPNCEKQQENIRTLAAQLRDVEGIKRELEDDYEQVDNKNRELANKNAELMGQIRELRETLDNIKPKEVIVPAGEINEMMYDMTKDLHHWYWIQSRGLSDAIRNDKFAEKLNNMHRYVSSIKTSEG